MQNKKKISTMRKKEWYMKVIYTKFFSSFSHGKIKNFPTQIRVSLRKKKDVYDVLKERNPLWWKINNFLNFEMRRQKISVKLILHLRVKVPNDRQNFYSNYWFKDLILIFIWYFYLYFLYLFGIFICIFYFLYLYIINK